MNAMSSVFMTSDSRDSEYALERPGNYSRDEIKYPTPVKMLAHGHHLSKG